MPERTKIGAFRLDIHGLAEDAERRQRYVRVLRAGVLVLVVLGLGTFGYSALTDGQYTWIQCLYMTVVTVSTVGFTEVIPANTDALMLFNISLIFLGGGALLYFLTSITAVVIEGDLLHNFWRRRMAAQLDRQHRHVILAGIGRTGMAALEELLEGRYPVVVIENNPERVQEALVRIGSMPPFVLGDALDENVLRAAGIERAAGLVSSLQDDRENLYLVVTARQLREDIRLVSKVERSVNIPKFTQVGADAVVHTARLGGQRLAGELIDPQVLAFTDTMLAGQSRGRKLREFIIRRGSAYAGRSISEARIRDKTGCIIVGLRTEIDADYQYHPSASSVLEPGGAVMLLGDSTSLRKAKRLLEVPR
ncbi:MAG: potassium channel protein [Myxococcota bacterium]|nr:potassium channel protein [Myxococcota bacterium]